MEDILRKLDRWDAEGAILAIKYAPSTMSLNGIRIPKIAVLVRERIRECYDLLDIGAVY